MVGLGMAGRDGECGEDPRVRASGPNSITFSILNLLLTPPLPALQTPFYSPRSPFFLFPSPRPSTLPAFVFFLLPAPPPTAPGEANGPVQSLRPIPSFLSPGSPPFAGCASA